MEKLVILILMIGCLLCCQEPIDIYTGTLSGVEYSLSHERRISEVWTLTFEDGRIYTIRKQPLEGLKIGSSLTIYQNVNGFLRAKNN